MARKKRSRAGSTRGSQATARALKAMAAVALRTAPGRWSEPRARRLLATINRAAKDGNARAQYGLARLYLSGQLGSRMTERARALLEAAASTGNKPALHDLMVLRQDSPARPGDRKQAIEWFLREAKHGSVDAEYSVGRAFYLGLGVRRSYADARKWFRRAANQGHVLAQAMLAEIYRLGLGTTKSERQAVDWYRRAAAGGDAESQYRWGVWLLARAKTKRERDHGIRWLEKAADLGERRARVALEREVTVRDQGGDRRARATRRSVPRS